ncbi:hypothetical protein M2165_004171 [Variovorax sp. TBS-050B]|uniref:hypothetical protein n=1 Tax=Variovorax sp. TBS-050B TaxID=2940551 RepID=UPI0024734380|nr:hypothetical protein [Variovorax sp. TBS-050B]MDH6594282.1 hypothetical protein [Variovorax sp. TBS-050B]
MPAALASAITLSTPMWRSFAIWSTVFPSAMALSVFETSGVTAAGLGWNSPFSGAVDELPPVPSAGPFRVEGKVVGPCSGAFGAVSVSEVSGRLLVVPAMASSPERGCTCSSCNSGECSGSVGIGGVACTVGNGCVTAWLGGELP